MVWFPIFTSEGKTRTLVGYSEMTKEILVDSGAHSFQKGKKVEWEGIHKGIC